MFFWLLKICVLSLLDGGLLRYCFYFEDSLSFWKWLKEMQTPITQLEWRDWRSRISIHSTMNNILMTFQSRSAKVDPADIYKGFKKHNFLLLATSTTSIWISHFAPVLAFPVRSPRIRHRSGLTERDWENAPQWLGDQARLTAIFALF